jgi:calcineurin-like phosphoesterase family protein
MEQYFISDHHWYHHNIIEYGKRPFKNIKEMHDALAQWHNETVRPQDHVSFLGDVTLLRGGHIDRKMFADELKKYNGHKRLYLGNHDHFPVKVYLEAGFEKIYATWRNHEALVFSHIPIHPRSLGSAIANVHGHIHSNPDYDAVVIGDRLVPYINVCVEAVNYRPVHLDELLSRVRLINGK